MTQKKELTPEETVVDPKSGTTRRTALKKIAVGTGVAAGAAALPGKWTKPLVDKVLVPIHAQTSPPPDPCSIECQEFFVRLYWSAQSLLGRTGSADVRVKLRIYSPDGILSVPDSVDDGCIEINKHSNFTTLLGTGSAHAVLFGGGGLSVGRYAIYADVLEFEQLQDGGTPSTSGVNLLLDATACDANSIGNANLANASGNIGEFLMGSINVSSGGTVVVRTV